MAQHALPNADTYNSSGYSDQTGLKTSLYTKVDESYATYNDADFVRSPLGPASSVYVFKLNPVEDPVIHTGHIIKYRYGKGIAGGGQIDLTVQLRQGYVNEGSPGTLIHSEAHTNISDSWTYGTFTLTAGEAATITNYSDLHVRLVANQI